MESLLPLLRMHSDHEPTPGRARLSQRAAERCTNLLHPKCDIGLLHSFAARQGRRALPFGSWKASPTCGCALGP